ncbi:response regulator [Cohnella sp. GbtcB17]|uniref:response regulator n=1 Tax=Cohnella sp. GbtcB17 TaxID=2824762 RepID=UPI001C302AB8|nr:response regulator [Cohnella sp. GbtcB17]
MNILIVDDEPMIREWFQMTLEKAGDGYRIVGEASNGEDAVAFCRAHAVDLVVTDVKMPRMNGLELIKALKEELPRVRTVVFSSYNEFQFAAEALKFGASEYILKAEITLQGLVDILRKIKRDIELDRRAATEMNALRHRLNESQLTLRSAYLRELLEGGREAAASFEGKIAQFGCRLSAKQLNVLVVGLLRGRDGQEPLRIQEDDLLQVAVTNILDETLLGEFGNGCSLPYRPDLYVLLANPASTGMKSQRESLLLLASRVQEHLQRFVGAASVVGISHTYSQLSYLPEQLTEARTAAGRHLFYGEPGIAWYGETDRAPGAAAVPGPSGAVADFHGSLLNGFTDLAYAAFAQAMDEIAAGKALPAKQVRAIVLELIYAAMNRARTSGVPMDRLEALYNEAHVEVQRLAAFKELRGWAEDALSRIFAGIDALRPKYGEAVQRGCEYIALHFAEDILLQDIASHVHLSRTYFSELFKKETGMNWSEYLLRLRMEKAQEALRDRAWKVSELAAHVGYSNTSYFIKLFKSYAGVSPHEFMEAQRRT